VRIKLKLPRDKAEKLRNLHENNAKELSSAVSPIHINEVEIEPGVEPPAVDAGTQPLWDTDEALIAAFYEGDDDALEKLRSRYRDPLFVCFKGMGVSDQTAYDLLHGQWNRDDGVFERIYQTRHREPGRAGSRAKRFAGRTFWPWILTIARNLAYDALRRKPHEVEWPKGADERGWEPPAPDTSEVEHVKEIKDVVHRCMNSLPDREREAMELWLFLGDKPKLAQLAEAIGQSVPTASRVLERAYGLMRRCLTAHFG
jgi:RNA polymerase sigma factor (sigma-70 family)